MNVLCSVDLSVQINNRGSASKSTVSSKLSGTDPVVGAARRWGLWQTGDVFLDSLVDIGDLELNLGVLLDGLDHALDSSNDDIGIGLVVQVW